MNNFEACMNSLDIYIDVLKEESARLSNMITKLNDKIQEAETKKEQLIKEQNEPKFERVVHGERYYHIGLDYAVCTCPLSDTNSYYNKMDYDNNNYFYTKERAQEVADKIKFLLKLERFHDIYCPDYKPNWEETSEHKYCVFYDSVDNKYYAGWRVRRIPHPDVFFPTEEIAQKVCDILNSEEQNSESRI